MTDNALPVVPHTFTPSTKCVASVTQAVLNARVAANNALNAQLGFTCLVLYAWTYVPTTIIQTIKQEIVILVNFHVKLAA